MFLGTVNAIDNQGGIRVWKYVALRVGHWHWRQSSFCRHFSRRKLLPCMYTLWSWNSSTCKISQSGLFSIFLLVYFVISKCRCFRFWRHPIRSFLQSSNQVRLYIGVTQWHSVLCCVASNSANLPSTRSGIKHMKKWTHIKATILYKLTWLWLTYFSPVRTNLDMTNPLLVLSDSINLDSCAWGQFGAYISP